MLSSSKCKLINAFFKASSVFDAPLKLVSVPVTVGDECDQFSEKITVVVPEVGTAEAVGAGLWAKAIIEPRQNDSST